MSVAIQSAAANAKQFVFIGQNLAELLQQHEQYRNYTIGKEDKFIFLQNTADISQNLLLEQKDTTLFIVKYFDSQTKPHTDNNANNNFNHIQGDDNHFRFLNEHKCSILGIVAFLQCIKQLKCLDDEIKMVPPERPVQNFAMKNMILTLSGVSAKQEAQKLLTLTRWMGARSREDVNNKTTHLVAANPRGIKYRRATEFGLAIMSTEWVIESFKLARDDIDFDAGCPEIVATYKLKPFQALQMAFVGFKDEDLKELIELTNANGGTIVELEFASHIIMDAISGCEGTTCQFPGNVGSPTAHIVYKEWFWASLEMEGKANEDVYAVPQYKTLTRRTSKIRSSTGYNSFSVMSPMLDYSRSPDSMHDRRSSKAHVNSSYQTVSEPSNSTKISPRHRACLELVETERNYVRILSTIVNLFKKPLESPEMGEPILPATDVKIIFGNIDPIYEVHQRMLGQLEDLIDKDWKETNLIGKVFVAHSIDLLKAYPAFVNFFEDTKKTIQTCDFKYPRFHAFLKRCQSRVECNRESLTEMVIRPVQRLPSISLILNELIKKTSDCNPDKVYLREALESIKKVMNMINEDKRKTEGQIAMFDIVNSIEECPADLLSALRKFICKVEARLLFLNSENEIVPSRNHKIILFVFADMIEICKIRSLKRTNSVSTRNYAPLRRGLAMHLQNQKNLSQKKDYRHLDGLPFYDIKNVYRNFSSPELKDAVVIQARPSVKYDHNFRYYPILLEDNSISKDSFVDKIDSCLLNLSELESVIDYAPNNSIVSNDEVDFGYATYLVNTMEKSRISRVLSIRPNLLSPSVRNQRNIVLS